MIQPRTCIFWIVFLSFSCALSAQLYTARTLPFAIHLVQQKKYDDALHVVARTLVNVPDTSEAADSLRYYMAYCYFKLDRPDSAKKYFSLARHSANTSLKENSTTLNNHLRIRQLDSLVKIHENAGAYAKEVNRVQTLAYLLLVHDLKAFKQEFDKEKCKFIDLAALEFNLFLYYHDLLNLRKKNSFLAGALSAIVPGLGKWYAGKRHEALIALIPVVVNGAQAYEGYRDKQFKSSHLYVFGSIGMVFYLSNIYGSSRSAKIINEEKYEEIRLKIFYCLDSIVAKL